MTLTLSLSISDKRLWNKQQSICNETKAKQNIKSYDKTSQRLPEYTDSRSLLISVGLKA